MVRGRSAFRPIYIPAIRKRQRDRRGPGPRLHPVLVLILDRQRAGGSGHWKRTESSANYPRWIAMRRRMWTLQRRSPRAQTYIGLI